MGLDRDVLADERASDPDARRPRFGRIDDLDRRPVNLDEFAVKASSSASWPCAARTTRSRRSS